MANVVPNVAELTWLDILLPTLDGATLHLFKNDLTPGPTTLGADFVEATFPSYAAADLGPWGAVATGGDGRAITTHPVVTFTRGAGAGSETIYGFYVLSASLLLLFAARNPSGGVLIDTAGQPYTVLPRFQLTEIGG